MLCFEFSDCWNRLDFISLLVYLAIFLLRVYVATWSEQGVNNRALFVASFLYGFNSLCLTFRAFGHVMEQSKHIGTIQIALFSILSDIRIVLGQFVVAILAFSFALAKVYMAEKIFIGESRDAHGMWVDIFPTIFCLNFNDFLMLFFEINITELTILHGTVVVNTNLSNP